jgi:Flp pilus assembly protein TadG
MRVRSQSGLVLHLAAWMRLVHDRRGVGAVEFAMIVPILVLLYVGIVEVGNALTIYRRTSTVSATAADLTAQTKTVSTGELNDIISASSSIIAPYSPDPLRLVISSVVADQNNNGKVAWSYANKGATRAVNSTYNVPSGLTEAGSSVIVAELTYDFKPLLGLSGIFSPGEFQMKRTFYARPRKSLTVKKCEPGNC